MAAYIPERDGPIHLAHIISIPKDEDDAWWDQALCRGQDQELFFRGTADIRHRTTPTPEEWQALKLCTQCPVRSECFNYGSTEKYGVWGGTLPGPERHWVAKQPDTPEALAEMDRRRLERLRGLRYQ